MKSVVNSSFNRKIQLVSHVSYLLQDLVRAVKRALNFWLCWGLILVCLKGWSFKKTSSPISKFRFELFLSAYNFIRSWALTKFALSKDWTWALFPEIYRQWRYQYSGLADNGHSWVLFCKELDKVSSWLPNDMWYCTAIQPGLVFGGQSGEGTFIYIDLIVHFGHPFGMVRERHSVLRPQWFKQLCLEFVDKNLVIATDCNQLGPKSQVWNLRKILEYSRKDSNFSTKKNKYNF